MANNIEIDETLLNEIQMYCELNGFKPNTLINDWVGKAFMEEKWLRPDVKFPGIKEVKQKILTDELTPVKPIETKEIKNKNDIYGE